MINITQYIDALDGGERCFVTLRGFVPERDVNDDLLYTAGGEAVVFRMMKDGRRYGLKCYTAPKEGMKKHYAEMSRILKEERFSPYMEYKESELVIVDGSGGSMAVDVLLYEWAEGITLLDSIEENIRNYDKDGLLGLCREFVDFGRRLLDFPMVHGDLKPQNIVVDSEGKGKMFPIDYDMAFAPGEQTPLETVRTQWYRHPKEEEPSDGYSIAVIAVSLFMLALDPGLFYKYNNGENIIIDTHKATQGGVLNAQLYEMLKPYPNYSALLDIVTSPMPSGRDIKGLLDNIRCESPDIEILLDENGELRRFLGRNGLIGFVDEAGALAIGCCYGDATPFRDGIACVRLNGLWYVLNRNGIAVLRETFEDAGESAEGLLPVCSRNRWRYLDTGTLEPVSGEYRRLWPFSEGLGLVFDGEKYLYIDRSGAEAFDGRRFAYARPFRNGFAIVGDDSYYIINDKGKPVSEPIQEKIISFDGGTLVFRSGENLVRREFCIIGE